MIVQNSFPIKTEFSPVQDTTPFAGVLPFMNILADRKILGLPGDRSRSQGWLDGQMVLFIMLLNLLGFDRVSDIDELEDEIDETICPFLAQSGTLLNDNFGIFLFKY